MKRLWLLVLLMLVGCGGDPALSRLGSGTEALIYPPNEPMRDEIRKIWISKMPHPPAGKKAFENDNMFAVPLGAKVRVVRDDESDDSKAREVQVHALEGENKGQVGFISRDCLRPLPKS